MVLDVIFVANDKQTRLNTDNTPKLALREDEAAVALGIKVKTLRNWRCQTPQKGPRFARLGRTVVYPIAELERYLNAHLSE